MVDCIMAKSSRLTESGSGFVDAKAHSYRILLSGAGLYVAFEVMSWLFSEV